MARDEVISRDIITLKEYGNYIGSTMNEQLEKIDELEKRISELESIILRARDIDWKTVRYNSNETFK